MEVEVAMGGGGFGGGHGGFGGGGFRGRVGGFGGGFAGRGFAARSFRGSHFRGERFSREGRFHGRRAFFRHGRRFFVGGYGDYCDWPYNWGPWCYY